MWRIARFVAVEPRDRFVFVSFRFVSFQFHFGSFNGLLLLLLLLFVCLLHVAAGVAKAVEVKGPRDR